MRTATSQHRPRLRPFGQGADRQGHVGGARPHGRHARAEDRPSQDRRQHRLGAVSPTAATLHATHYHAVDVFARQDELRGASRSPALDALLTIPLADGRNWSPDEIARRARQQCPGHPRLCRALDRSGRRLLEGARHPRCRPDGGPRDAAHLLAAHGQLAAPRRLHGRARSMPRCGGWRPRSTRRTPAIRSTGRWRGNEATASPSRRRARWCSRASTQPNGYTEPLLHRFRRR